MPSKSGKGGSGSGSKEFRIGDYVREKGGDKRRGRIVGGDASAFQVDIKGEDAPVSLAASALDRSNSTFGNFGGQIKEVLLNSVLFAGIQGIRKSDTFGGQRSINFLISDALYELLLKGFVEGALPMIRPDSVVKKEDREKFFASSDFMNGVAKAIPIVAVMQAYGSVMQKHGFSQNIGRNILDAAVACSVSNVIDRKFFADKEKTYSY